MLLTDNQKTSEDMERVLKVTKKGKELLQDSYLNKGTAFTLEERRNFDLLGRLPAYVSTLDEQMERSYKSFVTRTNPIERHYYLVDLQNRNETLFFRLLLEHVGEMLPYVYTPTVGDASIGFILHHRQVRGLYLSIEHKDELDTIFSQYEQREIDVIVVTDGERILGLGDMGVGGIVIPIGKLALYTVFAGIHPLKTLPIVLDVGTNNENLLKDPYYIGLRKGRVGGESYFAFIEEFVRCVKKHFPKALLQWEDFSKGKAKTLLLKYENALPSFNDDIQGTAAVTLAGIFAALRRKGSDILQERIAIYGAGSAGLGIAELIVDYLIRQGVRKEEAYDRIYIFNSKGLVHENTSDMSDDLRPFATPSRDIEMWDVKGDKISLPEVIRLAKITMLIGVSASKGAFDKKVVEAMLENTDRPVIFPLSNPNSKCEADPADLIKWSKGQAIVATGSPYPLVEYKKETFEISQCNNVYVYPSMGLAISTFAIPKVTNGLFLAAARALADLSVEALDPHKSLYPPFYKLRKLTETLAFHIVKAAILEGLIEPNMSDLEIQVTLEQRMWYPSYKTYEE